MKAPICGTITQKIATDVTTLVDAPEFGQGETAESPIAAPNVNSTNEIAAARTAPANTALHSTKLVPGAGATVAEAIGAGPTCVMKHSFLRLAY